MTWINDLSADVAAGDVVVVGSRIGIALGDIADGAEGELAVDEVWEIAKAAPLVIDQGDIVYWDTADGNLNKTATDNTQAGYAFADAASAATTVFVKINA